ncbi:MCP four helix bundle domain-containing protein [Azospirillum melinis]|uniref:MCP four helix bundle domain-containing protein n=1 Tax=Azospirillum melinis TaxID=328839 RepID=UPI00375630AE
MIVKILAPVILLLIFMTAIAMTALQRMELVQRVSEYALTDRAVADLALTADSDIRRETGVKIKALVDAYRQNALKVIELTLQGKDDEAFALSSGEGAKARRAASAPIDERVEVNRKGVEKAIQEASDAAEQTSRSRAPPPVRGKPLPALPGSSAG